MQIRVLAQLLQSQQASQQTYVTSLGCLCPKPASFETFGCMYVYHGCQLKRGVVVGVGVWVGVYLFFKEGCFRVRVRVRVRLGLFKVRVRVNVNIL